MIAPLGKSESDSNNACLSDSLVNSESPNMVATEVNVGVQSPRINRTRSEKTNSKINKIKLE